MISASLSVPSLNIPGGDVGLDLAVQAGFEKTGDDVTNLSNVSATPRLELFGNGPDQVVAEPSATASMKSEYSGKFLGIAGLSVTAGPSLTAKIHLFQTATCYSLTTGYDIGASIELGKWGLEWAMDLFNATVFETDLVNTCDKVWTGPVKVVWEAESSSYACPWSYVCGWYPPGPEIDTTRKYRDDYTLTLSAIDPTKASQPGVGQRPASATGKGTQTITATRTDFPLGGTPVTYPWCNATVTTEPEAFSVQREYAFSLSPLERVGPGRMRWYVGAPGVPGSPRYPGESGEIIATRNVTYQHPEYLTYEGCGRSGTGGSRLVVGTLAQLQPAAEPGDHRHRPRPQATRRDVLVPERTEEGRDRGRPDTGGPPRPSVNRGVTAVPVSFAAARNVADRQLRGCC